MLLRDHHDDDHEDIPGCKTIATGGYNALVCRLAAIESKIEALASAATDRDRRYISLRRAASENDLSVPSLRRLIAAGKLTAHRPVPGKILVDRRELEALIAASTIRRRGQKLKH